MRYLLLTFLCVITLLSVADAPPEVRLKQGTVRGTTEGAVAVFKGIPFAAPPVDELRWKAPQPALPWEGTLEATEFAAAPYQPGNPGPGKSEDCLYLNVWTPDLDPAEKLPVLVWIYGGGFSFGTTAGSGTDGSTLAGEDVVVVSIAYRVGQLGFLAHPALSAENPEGVSGNYGLLDQIAGLQWIQDNIEAFGGDPERVTIFGESAGGISVSMLCASPLAKGLFQGAISQSGGSFGPTRATTYPGENMKTLDQAEADGERYAASTGASSLAELRALPPDSLPMGMGLGGAWPIVDGYVIPDNQYKLYQAGDYNDVPVLIGYNSDEGLSFTREKSPDEFRSNVRQRYGEYAERLLEAYPVGETGIPKSARDLNRDAAFGWHTWAWAELQSETGQGDVYLYYFDQHPDYAEGSPQHDHGSPHGQEVIYAFGTLGTDKPDATAADRAVSEAMVTYWTNFAKTGDPNGTGVPRWPAYSAAEPEVMYLTGKPHTGPVPSAASLRVLDEYFRWRILEGGEPGME